MKAIGRTSTAILCLILGIAASGFAQHEKQGEKQREPEKQAEPAKQAKPEQQHAQQTKQAAPARQAKPEQQHAQQTKQAAPARQVKTEQQRAQQQKKQFKNKNQHAQQQRGSQHPKPSRENGVSSRVRGRGIAREVGSRTTALGSNAAATTAYRIPDDRFRGYFGPEHGFRIYGLPFLALSDGIPTFQYSGYWFSLVDLWPESWASNWYDTDDVYVSSSTTVITCSTAGIPMLE